MVAAIICGLLSGVVGFLPLLVGLRMTKRVTATSNFGHMGILVLSLVASFAIMFIAAFACIALAKDVAMAFVLAEAVALSVTAIAYGICRNIGTSGKKG